MNLPTKLRTLFGWTASPEPEFLRFKAAAGVLPPLPNDSANAPMLAELLKKDPKQVTWDEIQAGQIALVAVMPLEALQARFDSLSDEFETVTGGKPFVHGTFPNPPKVIEGWRAGVVSLTEELAKFRRAKLMFERLRSTVGMFFGLPLIAAVLLGFWHSQDHPPPLWRSLIFAGFIGAGFSVLTRLYALAWSMKFMSQIEDAQAFKKGLVISCILSLGEGVIAACVIYLLFTSGLLTGDLFPAFDPPKTPTDNTFLRLFTQEPKTTVDMAKLLLWAFIAGFAERLVPDKLNRLAGEASDAKQKKQP
jgi:hypothetical protein